MFVSYRCTLYYYILVGLVVVAVVSIRTTNAETETAAASVKGPCHDSIELYETHPILCHMLDRVENNADEIASEMNEFARMNNLLVGHDFEWKKDSSNNDDLLLAKTTTTTTTATITTKNIPVVFAHGMGDSCFNDGMINIGHHTSSLLNDAYVTCIPTGDTKTEDTKNGYFLNMDASVDIFAQKISQDPKLRNGFHAIGFSQGNNVIRGYIARYNTPTVHTFISVNGVNAGEGTVPGCFPSLISSSSSESLTNVGGFCDLLLEQASRRAYTEFAQEHSFQANYWRDPRQKEQDSYHQYSQLAKWNNEGPNNNNQKYNENYSKTSKFIWIMATKDSMVWPKEGEHWGCPDLNDPFSPNKILPMNETEWYQKDLFGLKTAQEAGKNIFETFEGDHLQFEIDDFDRWITSYLVINDSNGNNKKDDSDEEYIDDSKGNGLSTRIE